MAPLFDQPWQWNEWLISINEWILFRGVGHMEYYNFKLGIVCVQWQRKPFRSEYVEHLSSDWPAGWHQKTEYWVWVFGLRNTFPFFERVRIVNDSTWFIVRLTNECLNCWIMTNYNSFLFYDLWVNESFRISRGIHPLWANICLWYASTWSWIDFTVS